MQLLVIPLIYAQTQYFLVYQAFVIISNYCHSMDCNILRNEVPSKHKCVAVTQQ